MLTGSQEARIERYVAALDRAMAAAPADERAEVVAGVREHIEAALADRPDPTDAEVDAVLRQLGDPVVIAGDAVPDATRVPPPPAARPALAERWVPTAVVAMIGAGFALFFLALPLLLVLAGVVLLWMSPLWSRAEKLVGTLVPLASIVVLAVLTAGSGAPSAQSCVSSDPNCPVGQPAGQAGLSWVGVAIVLLATAATLTVLWHRGTSRLRSTTPAPSPEPADH